MAVIRTGGGGYVPGFNRNAGEGDFYAKNSTCPGTGALHSTTPGGANTANGFDALYFNSGQFNASFGVGSMYANTTGSLNVALGDGALAINTTGSNNIAVGPSAGALLTNGSNNIDIGNPGGNGESGKIRIGTNNVQNATFIAGITGSKITGSPVYITASGQLGVLASSERYKTAITTMIPNSIKLQMLRPVTFHLKTEPEGTMQYGLIAEEVNQVYPELVIRNDQGGIEGVRYDELAPILLKEVQLQQRKLADQNQNLAAQAAQLKELNQQIAELQKLNRTMQLAIQSIQTRDAEAKKPQVKSNLEIAASVTYKTFRAERFVKCNNHLETIRCSVFSVAVSPCSSRYR